MRRYLVVDDNRAFADNLAEILVDAGAAADVVTLGEEALERASETRYDALITDMRMPVMGGAELLHRIRHVDPGLPVIVLTAYTHEEDLSAARHEGLLAVLPKPVPLSFLLDLLRSAQRDGLVALVEDDSALSDNLTEVLRSAGYATVTASSVRETQRLGSVRPFVGLVDLRVHGGPDGDAMRHLATKFPGLPLFVISAHPEAQVPVPCRRVFNKPFRAADLLLAIRELHESPHDPA